MARLPQLKNYIQVAGVHDREEAKSIATTGVCAIGIPLRLGYHEPDLSEAEASALVNDTPGIHYVIITYLTKPVEIDGFCRRVGVRCVQLHGDIKPDEMRELRGLRPDLRLFKSLIVTESNQNQLNAEVEEFGHWVDGFLTDTFDPETGATGATGQTHDWEVSKALVEISPKPVILAGGLNPENVAAAIRKVRPAGVDVHTGVEGRDGRKDESLVAAFVQNARKAFEEISIPE